MSWDDCSKYGDDFTMSGSTDIDYFRYYSGYDSGYESGYDHVPVDRVVRNSDGSASVHVSYNEEDKEESRSNEEEYGQEDENDIMETLPSYSELIEFGRERNKSKQIQNGIGCRLKKKEKIIVDDICADFFYSIGVPFSSVKNPLFEAFCEAVGRYGIGYTPPSMYELGFPLLERKVSIVNDMKNSFKKHWELHGCTLMLDGWTYVTDRTKRKLINFLVNCPEGTFYLYSINFSEKEETVDYLVKIIEQCMKQIGKKNVVQVCTYNTAKYFLVGKKLMEKHPHIFWTPCVAHCVELILQDIGKLAKFNKVITIGQKVTSFIYQDTKLYDDFLKISDRKELIQCGISRFATSFLTLNILLGMKQPIDDLLLNIDIHENWKKKTQVHYAIFHSPFYRMLEDCLKVSEPLLEILRMVDTNEKPSMGHISSAFRKAKDTIKVNFEQKEIDYKPILDIIDNRWKHHLDCPLFGAGAFLNPKVYYRDKRCDAVECNVYECAFQDCLDKMVNDGDLKNKILNDVQKYKRQEDRFGRKMTIDRIDHLQPLRWWDENGVKTPELKKIAIRILGLCCTASSFERKQSTFESISTYKRSMLEQETVNTFAYINYNRHLFERFQQSKKISSLNGGDVDPIQVNEVNFNSEWITEKFGPANDFIYDDEGLKWVPLKEEEELNEDSTSNVKQVPTIAPAKEQSLMIASAKEQALVIAPAKEQALLIAPAKEQVPMITPSKEQVSMIAPAKEQVQMITPAKEQVHPKSLKLTYQRKSKRQKFKKDDI